VTRPQWESERGARRAGFRSFADLALAKARAARLARLDYLESQFNFNLQKDGLSNGKN
jgi:hypothetical protein